MAVTALFLALHNHPPKQTNAEVPVKKQTVQHTESELKAPVVQPQPQAQVETPKPEPVAVAPVEPPKPKPVEKKYTPSDNRAIGKEMAAAKGWTGDQWNCLERLWTNESNWNHAAHNKSSGAHGIVQSLPASKMKSHGADYLTNPRTQIAWGLDYISNRYSTPCGALSFWNSKSPHWY